MNAKFYIYRNLHRGGFSVRLRSCVVDRLTHFVASNVLFKVSEPGRQRVLAERSKNVHAFVCAESYTVTEIESLGLTRVVYNPYVGGTFTVNSEPIQSARSVLFQDGRCYLLER